jgi:hypothetical protein
VKPQEKTQNTARMETLDELIANTLPLFLNPVPAKETLRAWFERASVPRFKSNPVAKRGGGVVWYSVAGVEKFLRSRMIR